jgi:subtilisin family serine protease
MAPWLAAQRVPDSYIVELSGEPVAIEMAKRGRRAAVADRKAQVRAQQQRMRQALEVRGAEILDAVETVANALIIRIPDAQAAALGSVPGVRRVYPDYLHKLHLDRALPLHGVPAAWQQIGGQERAGAGVKIAILDTGIDPKHPAFEDPSLAMPAGFPKFSRQADKDYTTSKVIVARSYGSDLSPEDHFGHGTAVAMTAAGMPNQGTLAFITGVAPKAYLGNYKIAMGDGKFVSSSVTLKALDDAVADGMDVINLSSGTPLAARPGEDIEVAAIERAAAAGVLVVTSAGNEGPAPNTMSSPATAPSAIAVGASSNDRLFATSVTLEGVPPYPALPGYDASGFGPSVEGPMTAAVVDVSGLDGDGMACGSLPEGSLKGRIALILRGVCYFEVKLDNVQAAGAVAGVIYTDAERPEIMLMNVGSASLPSMSLSYADGVDMKRWIADSPDLRATLQFKDATPFAIDPNRVVSFSSRGPNADLGIKPDLVAVGTWVHLATQKSDPAGEMYDPSGYITESGTSFSAPLVTGAAAVLKAARPGLTVPQYRSLLINSASPLAPASGEPFPVQRAGAGTLNLLAALTSTIAAFPSSVSFGIGGGTADVSRDLTLSNLGTAADTYAISVAPIGAGPAPSLSTTSLRIEGGQWETLTVRWTGAALEPGEYQGFLQIQGSASTAPVRIPYWYAVPSGVPRYLTILSPQEIPETAGLGARLTIVFRVTDASGIALLDANPSVTVLSGGGTAGGVVSRDSDVPGACSVVLTMGPRAGENRFRFQVGDLEPLDLVIQGQRTLSP